MISDEYGVPVLVLAKSPANTYVNLLKRRGFHWIVLPRRVFLGLTNPQDCAIIDVHVEQSPPRTVPNGATDIPVSDQWALLHLRMLDSLKVISESLL